MIVDKINNIKTYSGISSRMDMVIEYITKNDIANKEYGKYEIDSDNIYYLISEYETKNENKYGYEAHEKYIDLHFIINGSELIKYADITQLEITDMYDIDKDAAFYKGRGMDLILNAGYFAVFFPQDAHMPAIMAEDKEVKKAVFKIKTV